MANSSSAFNDEGRPQEDPFQDIPIEQFRGGFDTSEETQSPTEEQWRRAQQHYYQTPRGLSQVQENALRTVRSGGILSQSDADMLRGLNIDPTVLGSLRYDSIHTKKYNLEDVDKFI